VGQRKGKVSLSQLFVSEPHVMPMSLKSNERREILFPLTHSVGCTPAYSCAVLEHVDASGARSLYCPGFRTDERKSPRRGMSSSRHVSKSKKEEYLSYRGQSQKYAIVHAKALSRAQRFWTTCNMTGAIQNKRWQVWQLKFITPASASGSIKELACAMYLDVNRLRCRPSAALQFGIPTGGVQARAH
jgi:hypothetical protein